MSAGRTDRNVCVPNSEERCYLAPAIGQINAT
jgi:hypothetical protein